MSNTALLEKMGLAGLDAGYLVIALAVVSLILLIVVILLIVQMKKIGRLTKRLNKFTTGKDGKSLEESIAGLFEDNYFLKNQVDDNRKDIRTLYKKAEISYQKMGLVKYDAFNQMGGQLSFSLALLDENDNGFILNSVHSTEGCYSYTKEIKNGESSLSLGKEEAEALALAIGE